jgi:hypothetical protein
MNCNVSYQILGENGERKWVSNGGLICLKHDMYMTEMYMNIHLKN